MRFHNVQMQVLDNGAVLMMVGCKTLGFTSYDHALTELRAYYQDPVGTELAYAEKYGWAVGGEVASPIGLRQFDTPESAPIRSAVTGLGGIR